MIVSAFHATQTKLRSSLAVLLATIALSLGALSSSAYASSSAQTVFDETGYYLLTQYGGFSSVNPRKLPVLYQPKLSAACMDLANTCPAERAHPIVTQMVVKLEDKRTGFYAKSAESIREQFSRRGKTTGFGIRPAGTTFVACSLAVPRAALACGAAIRFSPQTVCRWTKDSSAAFELRDASERRKTPSLLSLTRLDSRVSVVIAPVTLEPELPSLQVRPDGIALLRVPDFVGRGPGMRRQRIHVLMLEAQQKNARAPIVDLRDNRGGLVTASFSVVAALIPAEQG